MRTSDAAKNPPPPAPPFRAPIPPSRQGVVEQFAGFQEVLKRSLDPERKHQDLWDEYSKKKYNKWVPLLLLLGCCCCCWIGVGVAAGKVRMPSSCSGAYLVRHGRHHPLLSSPAKPPPSHSVLCPPQPPVPVPRRLQVAGGVSRRLGGDRSGPDRRLQPLPGAPVGGLREGGRPVGRPLPGGSPGRDAPGPVRCSGPRRSIQMTGAVTTAEQMAVSQLATDIPLFFPGWYLLQLLGMPEPAGALYTAGGVFYPGPFRCPAPRGDEPAPTKRYR